MPKLREIKKVLLFFNCPSCGLLPVSGKRFAKMMGDRLLYRRLHRRVRSCPDRNAVAIHFRDYCPFCRGQRLMPSGTPSISRYVESSN